MVSSTFSGVSFPCICFMASLAFSIASSVSRLMLADSIPFIFCSTVEICATVCSRLCSCCFLRLSAVFAAAKEGRVSTCAHARHRRYQSVNGSSHHFCCSS